MLIRSDSLTTTLWYNIKNSFHIYYIMQPLQVICILLNVGIIIFGIPNFLTFMSMFFCILAFVLNVKSSMRINIS